MEEDPEGPKLPCWCCIFMDHKEFMLSMHFILEYYSKHEGHNIKVWFIKIMQHRNQKEIKTQKQIEHSFSRLVNWNKKEKQNLLKSWETWSGVSLAEKPLAACL